MCTQSSHFLCQLSIEHLQPAECRNKQATIGFIHQVNLLTKTVHARPPKHIMNTHYERIKSLITISNRELHGNGDHGITAVSAVTGLDFMTGTAVTAGMETAFTVVPR